jgi:predicted transcriptional regulator
MIEKITQPAFYTEKPFCTHRDILYDSDTMAEATVEELAGYISGSTKRKQVVDVLEKNGNETLETIERTTRTPKLMLERTLKDLMEKGVIKKQKDKYTLTENGAAAVTILHSMR